LADDSQLSGGSGGLARRSSSAAKRRRERVQRRGACRPTATLPISCPKAARRVQPANLSFKMDVKLSYPFRVSGIPASVIDEFRNLPDRELTERRVKRIVADRKPGFPCRISLQDADAGETVYLLNFEHLPGNSPYRSVGPIFVREIATETYARINEIPEVLRVPGRVFSVRAYDNKDMLVAAEVANNGEIYQAIQRKLADKWVAYLHIHNAGPGCYSCRIDRA
jgi:Protein of unknown function (DUF1203)